MWTDKDISEKIKNHRRTKTELDFALKGILIMSEQRIAELRRTKEMVEAWLNFLSLEPRYVIQLHLVEGLEWAKTIAEYENKWGTLNARSDRTLKRLQAKALKDIADFMNSKEENNEMC